MLPWILKGISGTEYYANLNCKYKERVGESVCSQSGMQWLNNQSTNDELELSRQQNIKKNSLTNYKNGGAVLALSPIHTALNYLTHLSAQFYASSSASLCLSNPKK